MQDLSILHEQQKKTQWFRRWGLDRGYSASVTLSLLLMAISGISYPTCATKGQEV